MPERPLLLFPTPEVTSKSNLGGGGGRPHLPTHFRQGERLAPKFTQLQEAVRARNIEIQQAVTGIDPEQGLVLTGDFVSQRSDRIDVVRYGLDDELLKLKDQQK